MPRGTYPNWFCFWAFWDLLTFCGHPSTGLKLHQAKNAHFKRGLVKAAMLAPSVIVGVLCCLAWVGALHHLVHLRRHSRLSPLAFRHRLLPLILALPLFLWLVPRLCSALWAPPVEAIILNGAPPIRIALKGQRPPPHAAYSRRRCVGNLEDVEETQGDIYIYIYIYIYISRWGWGWPPNPCLAPTID